MLVTIAAAADLSMKRCTKCLLELPLAEFTKGSSYCRSCQKARWQAYYAANRERLIADARERNLRNAERDAARIAAWKERSREDQKRKARERAAASAEQLAAYASAYRRQFPERNRAAAAVGKAIKRGRLIPEPCFVCGTTPSQAHHASYAPDMKLAVTWLCAAHHKQVHAMKLPC